MKMSISDNGLKKLEGIETFRAVAYDDAEPNKVLQPGDKIRGTLTQGYGTTGSVVKIGTTWTQEEAQQHLLDGLLFAENVLNDPKVVKVPLTQNQFDALVIFVYNIGIEAFKTSSALAQLNLGNYSNVPAHMALYNETTIDGKRVVSEGLINRRAIEGALFSTHGADEPLLAPMSVTPAPVAKKTLFNSKTVWGGIMASGGGALSDWSQHADAIRGFSDTLGNYADVSHYIHPACLGIMLFGTALTIYGKRDSLRKGGV